MNVTLDGGQHNRSLLRAFGFFHLRLKISDGLLHHSRRVEHGRQLHLARAEEFTHGLHAIQQHRVDDVERRIAGERVFENLLQALPVRALTQRFFAIDDAAFQFVLYRE